MSTQDITLIQPRREKTSFLHMRNKNAAGKHDTPPEKLIQYN